MSPWLSFFFSYKAAMLFFGLAIITFFIIRRMNAKKRKKQRDKASE
jgi:hypothetical protein